MNNRSAEGGDFLLRARAIYRQTKSLNGIRITQILDVDRILAQESDVVVLLREFAARIIEPMGEPGPDLVIMNNR
jgi:hypothetical protein